LSHYGAHKVLLWNEKSGHPPDMDNRKCLEL
jgi:hypothetical protein